VIYIVSSYSTHVLSKVVLSEDRRALFVHNSLYAEGIMLL
jgi:hypothetical protein